LSIHKLKIYQMKICKNCNTENPVDAKFCRKCGTELNNEDPEGFVFVKGGTFMMGTITEQGNDWLDSEKPAHSVTLSDFYIGKYAVTQKEWFEVMGMNPSWFEGDNLPVEQVSWDEVQEFIGKLNVKTGKNYRLPTEAEWEYAARGGTSSRGYRYSGSDHVDRVACYYSYRDDAPFPVGTKEPNELGIYDMSGNVWEWCSDWYGAYSSHSQTNPTGPSAGSGRVTRGGSWYDIAHRVRISFRNWGTPSTHGNLLGFRLAYSSK
jgi:formylglycine-generating enzyme required for sulfatase activity